MLPDFQDDGCLPPGDYPMNLNQLLESMLVGGREDVTSESWDAAWRRYLVTNLEVLARQLWSVGIERIFVDGSFVENKDKPGDIDGYFECDFNELVSGRLEAELQNAGGELWTWSERREFEGKLRLPTWLEYRVELFPHPVNSPIPPRTGITDEFGNDLEFPAAFRKSREHHQKGIVRLVK